MVTVAFVLRSRSLAPGRFVKCIVQGFEGRFFVALY